MGHFEDKSFRGGLLIFKQDKTGNIDGAAAAAGGLV